MGRSHAVSGALVGTVVALPFSPGREALWPGVAPVMPWPVLVLWIIVVGGSALLPDLDHPSATVSRSLWFVTGAISRLLGWASLELYYLTAGPRDRGERQSGHRLITHTPVGAVTFGAGVTLAVTSHPIAAAVTVGLLAALMADGVSRVGLGLLVTCGGAAWWVTATYPGWWWVWGLGVTLGCQVHREGDWCTPAGVPRRSWPRMVAGKRWDTVTAPATFRTNGDEETSFVYPGLIAATVLAVVTAAGLLPPLLGVLGDVGDAIRHAAGRG